MALLELLPVLVAMINLNLVQTDTGEPLIPDAKPIPASVVDKDALIHSSGIQKRELECSEGYYRHPDETHCCLKCPRGTYIAQHCLNAEETSKCSACPEGSFMPEDHFSERCLGCLQCRRTFGQIEVSKCTSENDTVCGCGSDQYQSSRSLDFMCKSCSDCPDGRIQQPCTKFSDTVCESASMDFFSQKQMLPMQQSARLPDRQRHQAQKRKFFKFPYRPLSK
uniref:tumor necrosis factor receptor superfamily member 1A-like n=1 Tax=Podarcis muralis TaxID=64176 RepID=UPI0010A0582A|nr:tumor necrosis factor receptor superfamily member 1A-like [Podarcis muralis]